MDLCQDALIKKIICNFKAKNVLITECFDPECGEKMKIKLSHF